MALSLSQFSKERRKRAALVSAIVLMTFSVPILFENCSQAPSGSDSVSSVASTAGFAYNTAVDTLAYMSCSGYVDTAIPNNYFTFRAGSLGTTSGVQINQNFANAARNLNVSDKIAAIQQSTVNNNIYAQLSVRSPTAADSTGKVYGFQVVYGPPSGSINTFYASQFVGSLSQTEILNTLFSGAFGTDWHNNFTVAGTQQNFFGSIQFTDSELEASNIRAQVGTGGPGYLSLNYAPVGSFNSAVAPTAGSLNSIYGTGYKFTFGLASGHTSGIARAVTAVSEYDLSTQAADGHTWACDPSLVFTVVNGFNDLGHGITCTANNPVTAAQISAAASIRAILPAATWGIDYVNKCVYPLSTSTVVGYCNGSSAVGAVNYTGAVCNAAQPNNCPHYVSICTRN